MIRHNPNTSWGFFKKFLKTVNMPPETFILRVLQTRRQYITHEEGKEMFLRDINLYGGEIIMNMITWDNTPEGGTFWNELYIKHQEFFKKYQKRYDNSYNPRRKIVYDDYYYEKKY